MSLREVPHLVPVGECAIAVSELLVSLAPGLNGHVFVLSIQMTGFRGTLR